MIVEGPVIGACEVFGARMGSALTADGVWEAFAACDEDALAGEEKIGARG